MHEFFIIVLEFLSVVGGHDKLDDIGLERRGQLQIQHGCVTQGDFFAVLTALLIDVLKVGEDETNNGSVSDLTESKKEESCCELCSAGTRDDLTHSKQIESSVHHDQVPPPEVYIFIVCFEIGLVGGVHSSIHKVHVVHPLLVCLHELEPDC